MRLLIVDDETPMRTALMETLSAEGYRVLGAADGEEGLELACTESFDLILLDVMMPKLDGYAMCRALRQRGKTMPVLMLTAKGQVDDRVEGLDCGADDYLVKPFSLRELFARVRALLRRQEQSEAVPDRLAIGQTEVDFNRRTLHRDGETTELSTKELGILQLLTTNLGKAVSRETFLDVVWGYHAYPSTRTVDNFISGLRAKLEVDPANPSHLITVRGEGYRLDGASPIRAEG